MPAIERGAIFPEFFEKVLGELEKQEKLFKDIKSKNTFDIIYFDAFGARVQPELWTEAIFEKMYGDMGVPLPGPTKAVLAASRFVSGWGGFYLVLGFVLFYITYTNYFIFI